MSNRLYQFKRILVFTIFLWLAHPFVIAQKGSAILAETRLQANSKNEKERLEAVTKLGFYYINPENYHPDTSLQYADTAIELAKRIHDNTDLEKAILLYARTSLQLSLANQGLVAYKELRQLTKANHDEQKAALALHGIGTALWYQGKFKEAIDTIKLTITEFKRLGIVDGLGDANMVLSSIYSDEGNYENAFEEAQEALLLSQRNGDKGNIILSLVQMGYLYMNIGDYPTAMDYYKKAMAYNPPKFDWTYRHLSNRLGEYYCDLEQYDSAFYYFNHSLTSHAESKTSLLHMADYLFLQKDYEKSKNYYKGVYNSLKDGGEGNLVIFALLGMSKTELRQNNIHDALNYGYKGLSLARQRDSRLTLRDAYQALYLAYDALHKSDSALNYYKLYVTQKELVVTNQFKGRLYAYKQESKISMLEDQKLISDQRLNNTWLLRNLLIAGIVAIALLAIIIFWLISLKRKNEMLRNERVQTELKRRAAELEMQALRAQMNPHFIFNALSSVNKFILQHDPEKASDYLTRFSRLIRLVLVNSQKETIVLEEEIQMLNLYLQMEQMRFRNAFDYHISYNSELDPSAIYIPPLLIQPFCENAIWHGLMHSEKPGRLFIDFQLEESYLQCIITDNGIGRDKAAALGSKSAEKIKSLGLHLTRERLALFNNNLIDTSYEINDIKDENENVCGTQVVLKIRKRQWKSLERV